MVKNITAGRLADKIDADEQFTFIETRPEDSFEAFPKEKRGKTIDATDYR